MIYLEPEMQFLRKTRHGWWFADPSHVTAHIRKLSRLFIKPCSSERFKFPLRREKEPRNGWWPLATFRHRGSARRRRWGRYKKHHLLYKCISECVVVMSIWICSNRLRIYRITIISISRISYYSARLWYFRRLLHWMV